MAVLIRHGSPKQMKKRWANGRRGFVTDGPDTTATRSPKLWLRGPIDDQIRVDRKEFHIFVGQILPPVAGTRGSGKKYYFFADGGFNAVRNCEAGLFFDVTPDFDEIERSLRRKNKPHAHLGSAFQIRQVGELHNEPT